MTFSEYQQLHETIPDLYPIAICNFLGILPFWPYEPTESQTRNPLQAFILEPGAKMWTKVPISRSQYNTLRGIDTVIFLNNEPLFVENIEFTVIHGHDFAARYLQELILFSAKESIALPLDDVVWLHMTPERNSTRKIIWWPKNSLQIGIENLMSIRERHRNFRRALGMPLADENPPAATIPAQEDPGETIGRVLQASHRRSF